MKRTTVFLFAVGVALLTLAGVELSAPGTLPIYTQPATATAIGIGVLLYALVVSTGRLRRDYETLDTPDPEYAVQASVPGEDLDETLARFPGAERIYRTPAVTTREGLRRAAISVLSRFHDESTEAATRQVDAGEWTDDQVAARYLRTDSTAAPSLAVRVRRFVSEESYESTVVDRTVEAILDEAETVAGTAGAIDAAEETASGGPPDSVNADPGDEGPADPREVGPPTVRGDDEFEDGESNAAVPTHYWTGIGAVAVLCLGTGVILELPAIALAGIVGFGFAAYARLSTLPVGHLSVERTVEPKEPDPGEELTVTVTVTNESDSLVADLRLIDGVPAALSVVAGSPRHGTALRAGESVEFEYGLTARRGSHEFGPLLAVSRNLSGSVERTQYVECPTSVTCRPQPTPTKRPVPLRAQTAQYTGPVDTDIGGEGVEFHTVREYAPGDAVSRIDWNRRARTGELSTIEFSEQRAARIVLAIDARPEAYVAHDPGESHAVDRSVAAAGQAFERLLADGHQVGIAAFGDGDCWLAPGGGDDHRIRGRELLGTHPALSSVPADTVEGSSRWEQQLRQRLAGRTQLIVFTPLSDPGVTRVIRRFEARGHPVTVVSPDATSETDPRHRLEAVRRGIATADLRRLGIPVLDWGSTESFDHALATHVDRS